MLLRIQMAFHQVSFIFTNLSSHTKAFFYLRLKNSALELDGFSGGGERRGREREREREEQNAMENTQRVCLFVRLDHTHMLPDPHLRIHIHNHVLFKFLF